MATTLSKCHVCGQSVYRNSRGEVLIHTRQVKSGPNGQEVCGGWKKGTRP